MVVFSCIPWTSWIVAHLLYQKAGGLLDSAGPGRIHSLHLPMSFPKCFKTTDFTFQRPCLQRCPCSDGTSHRETSEHHALWRDAPLLTSKLVKLYNVILCYTAYIYVFLNRFSYFVYCFRRHNMWESWRCWTNLKHAHPMPWELSKASISDLQTWRCPSLHTWTKNIAMS